MRLTQIREPHLTKKTHVRICSTYWVRPVIWRLKMLSDRYLKIGEVLERSSYSRAQIYRLMKSGEFPSSYRLSKNRVAWKESEVDVWVEERQSIFLLPPLDKGQKLLEEVWRR